MDSKEDWKTERKLGKRELPQDGETFIGADGTKSAVVADHVDADYDPTDEEVNQYGRFLGINIPGEEDLLWIARHGLKAPLPENWKPVKTEGSELYYFNFQTGASTWNHPLDDEFRGMIFEERQKKADTQITERRPDDWKTSTFPEEERGSSTGKTKEHTENQEGGGVDQKIGFGTTKPTTEERAQPKEMYPPLSQVHSSYWAGSDSDDDKNDNEAGKRRTENTRREKDRHLDFNGHLVSEDILRLFKEHTLQGYRPTKENCPATLPATLPLMMLDYKPVATVSFGPPTGFTRNENEELLFDTVPHELVPHELLEYSATFMKRAPRGGTMDMDPFLKPARPDGKPETLGLTILDEHCSQLGMNGKELYSPLKQSHAAFWSGGGGGGGGNSTASESSGDNDADDKKEGSSSSEGDGDNHPDSEKARRKQVMEADKKTKEMEKEKRKEERRKRKQEELEDANLVPPVDSEGRAVDPIILRLFKEHTLEGYIPFKESCPTMLPATLPLMMCDYKPAVDCVFGPPAGTENGTAQTSFENKKKNVDDDEHRDNDGDSSEVKKDKVAYTDEGRHFSNVIDPFLKPARPDGKPETLGMTVLDEHCSECPSDADTWSALMEQ